MRDMDQAIREHAYHLWVAAGSPHGQADSFWLAAQRDMLASELGAVHAASDVVTTTAAIAEPIKAKASKPAAKTAKASKRKTRAA